MSKLTLKELDGVFQRGAGIICGPDARYQQGLAAVLDRLEQTMENRYAGRLAPAENPWDWLRSIAHPPEAKPEPTLAEAAKGVIDTLTRGCLAFDVSLGGELNERVASCRAALAREEGK